MNWPLLQNSLWVGGVTTVVSLLIGLAMALTAMGLEMRWRWWLLGAAAVAFALPPFLVTNCWLDLFGINGRFRSWLPFPLFSWPAVAAVLASMLWPIAFVLFLGSWQRLSPGLWESEPLLRGFDLMRRVLLPAAAGVLVPAMLLIFIIAVTNFSVASLLQVKVLPAEMWLSFNADFDYLGGLQKGWPLLLAPLLIVAAARRIPRWRWRGRKVGSTSFREQLGFTWYLAAVVLSAAVLAVTVAMPALQMVFSAETWRELGPALAAGRSALLNSAGLAAITATIVALTGLWLARWPWAAVAWIPFALPGVLVGIAMIVLFNHGIMAWIYQSAAVVVLAFGIRYAGPAVAVLRQGWLNVDSQSIDAVRVQGASEWQVLRWVRLPHVGPYLMASWYVTYLFCLWDVETLILIVPPGLETVSVRIFNLLHYGHNTQVDALCLMLLFIAMIPLLLWTAVARIGRWYSRVQGGMMSPQIAGMRGLALVLLAGVLVGCSRSDVPENRSIHPVRSRFFSHVEIIGSSGVAPGKFNKPRSIAVDAQQRLFAVDMTGRVQVFGADASFLRSWQMPQTDLGRPKGMSIDKEGHVIVVEPHYSRVNHFTAAGDLVRQWGRHGTNAGELAFPRAVAVDSAGHLFVSEYGSMERVQEFDPHGNFLRSIVSGNGEFNRPEGLGTDRRDRLYVADSCNHQVQIFGADRKFIRRYGRAGDRTGELSYPYDVRVDADGFQFVCEFGNSRIQVFDSDCRPVEILGQPGAEPGQFANPWSLAFDSAGNLYVADSRNHRIQKFVRKHAARRQAANAITAVRHAGLAPSTP